MKQGRQGREHICEVITAESGRSSCEHRAETGELRVRTCISGYTPLIDLSVRFDLLILKLLVVGLLLTSGELVLDLSQSVWQRHIKTL